MAIKFFYNGMKVNGELFKGSYTMDRHGENITMYASNYRRFPSIQGVEHVNDSDSYTDYFDTDKLIFKPDHVLYPQVLAAYEKGRERQKRQHEKWEAKAQEREAKRQAMRQLN